MNTVLESPERELTALDRCDRCGAQAYVQAIKEVRELLFCAHHGREHTPALDDAGWVMLDSSHKLNENPFYESE